MAGLVQSAKELPEDEDMREPGEPPEDTPADMKEDVAEGETPEAPGEEGGPAMRGGSSNDGNMDGTEKAISDDAPELQQIETQLMEKVPPEMRSIVERLVLAGMKVMVSDQMADIIDEQFAGAAPEEMPVKVAQAVASLVSILVGESRGPLPGPALVAAAILLMCQALDMLGKAGRMEVNAQTIAATTKELTAYLMQKTGVKPGSAPPGAEPQGPQEPPPAAPPQGGLVAQTMGG